LAVRGVDRPVVRSYSLSDVARADHYRITIGKVGLASTHLHDQVAVGDRIEVKAPAGAFTIDAERQERPVVLIGGGIGITPLLSMLEGIRAAEPSFETWLLYGVRDDRQHIMRQQLETIARTRSNIHLRVFYSRPARVDDPNIDVGHIDLEAMKRLLPSNACDFYVCGPAAMMESVARDLQTWGVPIERVHTEAFGPSAVKQVGQRPTSQADSRFDVTFERSGITARWSDGESPLLELAEENSVAIDFGCRAGSCGTCATRLLSGSVRYLHQPNAPLEPGQILPCIAVPAEPLTLDA
jgi:ferredoxin-NADP reductase